MKIMKVHSREDIGMRSSETGLTRRQALTAGATIGSAVALGGLATPAIAATRQLTIISNESTQDGRAAFQKIVEGFGKDAGVQTSLNFMDHEGHKTAIRNYLVTAAPDICFWFSGERMRYFVRRGLFEDISDLIEKQGFGDAISGTISAVTVDKRQYGLPIGGRLYGNFYLEDTFRSKGLTPPSDWDGLIAYVDKAKAAGLVPITLGCKEIWPVAGFFDIMNMRLNGLDFHMALMDGKASYLDKPVKDVFNRWRDLVQSGAFLRDSTSYTFQEAAALLGRHEAGFMNIGSYIEKEIPVEQRPNLRFFPFPKVAGIPRFEDFTVDSIHIPANGKNKDVGREFLAYFYRPENIGAYNESKNYVPARSDLPASQNQLISAQVVSLKGVAGTAQFFDRDTDPDMAQVAMKGFQEFMAFPDRAPQILERLEQTRKRVFK